jgi:hypothetical protein
MEDEMLLSLKRSYRGKVFPLLASALSLAVLYPVPPLAAQSLMEQVAAAAVLCGSGVSADVRGQVQATFKNWAVESEKGKDYSITLANDMLKKTLGVQYPQYKDYVDCALKALALIVPRKTSELPQPTWVQIKKKDSQIYSDRGSAVGDVVWRQRVRGGSKVIFEEFNCSTVLVLINDKQTHSIATPKKEYKAPKSEYVIPGDPSQVNVLALKYYKYIEPFSNDYPWHAAKAEECGGFVTVME